ncbi:TonB-dependent receptor [bacterium AH-315-K03]|nr:TonB-dependent receptor [bacterium AH-315-K03]
MKIIAILAVFACLLNSFVIADTISLEEVIVTAQKREQSIQKIPISIAVLNKNDLEISQINGLGDLNGLVPSLNIQSEGNTATSLAIAIRGHAPDPGQITREGSVGVYIDGVYISRSQALGIDLADPERIEVLRGPQGTLFGRNTVGGAVSIISRKPSGQFGVDQTISAGNYDLVRSVTHINLPRYLGLSTKIDYIHNEFGGWVDNTSGQEKFTEYNNNGGRLNLLYNLNEALSLNYAYDNTRTETAQYYFQLHRDFSSTQTIGQEPKRQDKSRNPTILNPNIVKQNGHSLNASWTPSSNLTIKSITGYHELMQDTHNNYGGVLYVVEPFRLIDGSTIDQKQFSQELQIIGNTRHFEWLAGLYYFEEDALQNFNTQFSLFPSDPFTIDSFSGETSSTSKAIFGQATWTPSKLEKLQLTLGARYTDDDKNSKRTRNLGEDDDIGSHSTDPLLAVSYSLTDYTLVYIKWSSAYKAVGYNLRSTSFEPYKKENNQTTELGIKSEFWDNRARLNVTAFLSVFKDMQLDFIDPDIITNPETKNAINKVRISGLELDMKVNPISALTLGASYTYLETDKSLQPNPLDTTLSQTFYVTQAPAHAGSLTIDYQVTNNLTGHLDITSTDNYAHVSFEPLRLDAYTLVNARFTLKIPLNKDSIDLSLWVKNLLDEEYITNGFSVGSPPRSITQVFGDPRTYGINLKYTL